MLIAALGELRRIKSPQFRVALGHRPRCTAQPGSGVPAGLQGDRPARVTIHSGPGTGRNTIDPVPTPTSTFQVFWKTAVAVKGNGFRRQPAGTRALQPTS